jgi:predicted mannosyl-3-phosphoglycerate phosphatase (HAD superfamily)
VILKNERELANTREKLRMLEEDYETVRLDTSEDAELRDLTMASLERLIKQLRVEIAEYEASRAGAAVI